MWVVAGLSGDEASATATAAHRRRARLARLQDQPRVCARSTATARTASAPTSNCVDWHCFSPASTGYPRRRHLAQPASRTGPHAPGAPSPPRTAASRRHHRRRRTVVAQGDTWAWITGAHRCPLGSARIDRAAGLRCAHPGASGWNVPAGCAAACPAAPDLHELSGTAGICCSLRCRCSPRSAYWDRRPVAGSPTRRWTLSASTPASLLGPPGLTHPSPAGESARGSLRRARNWCVVQDDPPRLITPSRRPPPNPRRIESDGRRCWQHSPRSASCSSTDYYCCKRICPSPGATRA